MNRQTNLWICLALGVCLVCAVLLSERFIAAHRDHDCCGAECPICLLIQGAAHFSRQLKSAAGYSGFALRVRMTSLLGVRVGLVKYIPLSPVRLNVKMNR
ncbi:MAG: hypothetical protein LBQ30_08265 [Treponema sp.]|jgi:hypothetical protein|nr:hypothetical protein [Treponema sp.]